jgi:molybdopterin converting factor small subunit
MMQIEVSYFAALREQIGADRETVELAGDTTARALLAHLGALHPGSAGLIERSRVAQSNAFVASGETIEAGAACDIIPPVSGG